MKDKFTEFLYGQDSSVGAGNDYYVKGNPIQYALDNGKTVNVTPIYRGYRLFSSADNVRTNLGNSLGIPDKINLYAYWLHDLKIYITDFTRKLDDKDIKQPSVYSILNDVYDRLEHDMDAWFQNNMEQIEASDNFSEEEAIEIYENGHRTIDMDAEIAEIKKMFSKSAKDFNGFDPIGIVAGDNTTVDCFMKKKQEYIKTKIASLKGMKAYIEKCVLEENDADAASGRKRAVKAKFLELEKNNVKTCTAIFDFGYEKVTAKLVVGGNSINWVEGTMKATERFEREYKQPASMSLYSPMPEDFYPYITSIVVKKKEVYHAEPIQVIPEDELYSYACNVDESRRFPYREKHDIYSSINKSQRPFSELFAGKDFDCSVPLYNGNIILNVYAREFYSTAENVKYLIEHGAEIDENFWRSYRLEKENVLCRNESRNKKEIMAYMETVMTF